MNPHDPALLSVLELSPVWLPKGSSAALQPAVAKAAPPQLEPIATPEPHLQTTPAPVAEIAAPATTPAAPARPLNNAAARGLAEALAAARGRARPMEDSPPAPAEATAATVAAPVAAPSAWAHLDWEPLAEQVRDCRACGLCQSRTQTVFGVGDRKAEWLIVGEAPGAEEDRRGEPFVGPAGQLLDNMLAALQLTRGENVYIANVLKCRPPANRDPLPDEVQACSQYLQRQVELLQPRVILALGRFAANTLLQSESSIAALRGKVHHYQQIPLIVSYHPAYLLRNLPDKAKSWQDLLLARRTWLGHKNPPAQA
ncbi:uracil-DNA glycosylase [Leeia aquatica]|uniref:Type-4 uracil-DNA glycosylase n=1 Tax=Leeia aquatica TaxID=2725557 RepID=A0A847S8S5_9NEIS|nr:uracil-DNA glycosylase [Leeia aquatica]NLR74006.1 uracil-DNA glycosylase [Leeia aquatica]